MHSGVEGSEQQWADLLNPAGPGVVKFWQFGHGEGLVEAVLKGQRIVTELLEAIYEQLEQNRSEYDLQYGGFRKHLQTIVLEDLAKPLCFRILEKKLQRRLEPYKIRGPMYYLGILGANTGQINCVRRA